MSGQTGGRQETVGESVEDKERETTPKHRRGRIKKSPQKVPQRTEAIQNLVEITETRLEDASIEDWNTFVNTLKVVKVDEAGGPVPGKKDHAWMYVPVLVQTAPN